MAAFVRNAGLSGLFSNCTSKGVSSIMKAICVFCGSSYGQSQKYKEAAKALGTFLARSGMTLIYGGGKRGLMGEVAEAALRHQGRVVGVIPQFLKDREVAHDGLGELLVVDTMHTRKAKMYESADGFIALPGGYGTYEELFEVLSWSRVGLHLKTDRPAQRGRVFRPPSSFASAYGRKRICRAGRSRTYSQRRRCSDAV